MSILTLNAGSSSIKYKLFNQKDLSVIGSGLIENIGEEEGRWHHISTEKNTATHYFKTHEEAFNALREVLNTTAMTDPIIAVGHRVVHGGEQFHQPTLITDAVFSAIQKLTPLAPLHNPVNIAGIAFARIHFNAALHIAVFDTGFHHNMPEYVRRYAIDRHTADQFQIRRYGFHGINHEYVARMAAHFLKKPLKSCHFITLHLGNGASSCLIKHGQSFDTSMGLTPLAGLVMGTRCGDVDPAIPLYLQKEGMLPAEIDKLLNKQSGLLGIGGDNDMRALLKKREQNDYDANLAIKMYIYSIQKTIGSYLAQLPTLDAIIFTGGVGENASLIRELIIQPLAHLGFTLDPTKNNQKIEDIANISTHAVPILVIRGDEERLIAEKVSAFI